MTSNQNFEFSCPVKIVFEVGGAAKIGQRLTQMGAKKCVCSHGQILVGCEQVGANFRFPRERGTKILHF